MLKLTIDIVGTENYSVIDIIRVQAQAIDVAESWLYAVAGDAKLDLETVKPFSHSRVVGTVRGEFDSLVSPYMFEVLDKQVGELDHVWSCSIKGSLTGV